MKCFTVRRHDGQPQSTQLWWERSRLVYRPTTGVTRCSRFTEKKKFTHSHCERTQMNPCVDFYIFVFAASVGEVKKFRLIWITLRCSGPSLVFRHHIFISRWTVLAFERFVDQRRNHHIFFFIFGKFLNCVSVFDTRSVQMFCENIWNSRSWPLV